MREDNKAFNGEMSHRGKNMSGKPLVEVLTRGGKREGADCGGTDCQEVEHEEICHGCGDGDKVPAKGYFRCPVCDAEWSDDDEDS